MNQRYEDFDNTISRIERALQKIKEREMQKVNLKGSSVKILIILHDSKTSLTAAQLTRLSGFDKAHISRILNTLQKQNLIAYSKEKKYASKISLTDKGEEVSQFMMQKIDSFVNQAGYHLDDEKRAIFYEVLTTITDNIERIYKQGEQHD